MKYTITASNYTNHSYHSKDIGLLFNTEAEAQAEAQRRNDSMNPVFRSIYDICFKVARVIEKAAEPVIDCDGFAMPF